MIPRSELRAASLVIALIGAQCASQSLSPAVGAEGKSLWTRVVSEHFVVETDLEGRGDISRVAGDLEVLSRAFLSNPLLNKRPPKDRALVVVLRSAASFRALFGDRTGGVFFAETPLGPVAIMPSDGGVFFQTTLKHELVHHLTRDFIPPDPRWLNEGLAQLMETARYDPKSGEVRFGYIDDSKVYIASRSTSTERFLGAWPKEPEFAYYGGAWLLTHYLVANHLTQLLLFQRDASEGVPWREAWRRHIGLDFGQLDAILGGYIRKERLDYWKVSVERPEQGAFVVSEVPRAEALALRAGLAYLARRAAYIRPTEMWSELYADLERAAVEAPDNPRVMALRRALEQRR